MDAFARRDMTRMDRAIAPDILRGILMVLVLFGHALQFLGHAGRQDFWDDPLFKAIYMFHMPLFMALAGWFAPRHAITVPDVLARARVLIWPMVPWALILAGLRAAGTDRWADLPRMAYADFLNSWWFLWAAFLALGLLALALRLGRWGAAVPVVAMAWLLSDPGIWGLVLSRTAFVLPFFFLGWLWRGAVARGARLPWPVPVGAGLIAMGCFTAWDEGSYVYNNHADALTYPGPVLLMFGGAAAAALAAGAGLWALARAMAIGMARSGTGCRATRVLAQVLARIGRATLEIYLLQEVVFALLRSLAPGIPGAGTGGALMPLLITPPILALTLGFVGLTQRHPGLSRLLWGRSPPASVPRPLSMEKACPAPLHP